MVAGHREGPGMEVFTKLYPERPASSPIAQIIVEDVF
jgi:hypothetical protein